MLKREIRILKVELDEPSHEMMTAIQKELSSGQHIADEELDKLMNDIATIRYVENFTKKCLQKVKISTQKMTFSYSRDHKRVMTGKRFKDAWQCPNLVVLHVDKYYLREDQLIKVTPTFFVTLVKIFDLMLDIPKLHHSYTRAYQKERADYLNKV